MFPKILFLVIKSKIQTKLKKNWQKTTKIGLANVQFYETKLHRGRKRHWVYELSKGSCHSN